MAFGTPPYVSHIGGQNERSIMGVVGTLGTADTAGTAPILPFSIDPLTGALYTEMISGSSSVSPVPTIGQSTFGTLGTTGATLVGTLVGGTSSGAGTEIFLTSLSLSIPSTGAAQDVSIGWGTASGTFHSGTASILRGMFLAGGGIQKTFSPAVNSGTNAQLCYFQAGVGTVSINITYFTTASTL